MPKKHLVVVCELRAIERGDCHCERILMSLLKNLQYNPVTGMFTWLISGRKRRIGGRAGNRSPNGYRSIRIDGTAYYEHRLAWLAVHGAFPNLTEIDHINGNPSDNKISNLSGWRVVIQQS